MAAKRGETWYQKGKHMEAKMKDTWRQKTGTLLKMGPTLPKKKNSGGRERDRKCKVNLHICSNKKGAHSPLPTPHGSATECMLDSVRLKL